MVRPCAGERLQALYEGAPPHAVLDRYLEPAGALRGEPRLAGPPQTLDGFADEAVELLTQNREVAAMPGRLEGIRAALERTVQDVLRARG